MSDSEESGDEQRDQDAAEDFTDSQVLTFNFLSSEYSISSCDFRPLSLFQSENEVKMM